MATIGRTGDGAGRRRLPRPATVLVPFIEVDELFMADKKITDVHISIFLRAQRRSVDMRVNYGARREKWEVLEV
jgi:hypothetical protein